MITELAKRILERQGIVNPVTDEEIRNSAYEAMKEIDFIQAHIFRLNKQRPDFTKEDWSSILEISGLEKVSGNMAAMMACLRHGLITPNSVR